MKPNEIIESFFTDYECSITEDFYEVKIVVEGTNILIPNQKEILDFFSTINSRDNVIIDISVKGLDSNYPITKDDLKLNLEELSHEVSIGEQGDVYKLNITIIKKIKDNSLSIYYLEHFLINLKNMHFKALLFNFNIILKGRNYFIFDTIFNDDISFYTHTLYFNHKPLTKEIDRFSIVKKRDEITNFINSSEVNLVPEDFKLIKLSEDDQVNTIFEKICVFLSLIFISDISSVINDNVIEIKINGYTLIFDKLEFNRMDLDLSDIYNIYEWTYTGGNISDKVGLVRNIISINYRANDTHLVKPNTFNSVKSGFAIYLKDNVQQYIDVTSKMGEYLLDLSFKVTDVIKTFGASFKNNNFIFISFFLSIIVFNSVSSGQFEDIFTKEIITISSVILIISLLYLLVSIYVVCEEVKKFKNDFGRFKKIYKDLLMPEDIERIFDKSFLEDNTKYVSNKITAYSITWGIELLMIAIMICYFR